MKQITRRNIACLAALAAVLILSCPAGAQAPAAAGVQATIAMVDIQKAAADYKGMKAANDEINKLVNDLKTDIETRATHKLMTEAELTELVALKKKTPRTDAENKRMDELEKIGKTRDEELNTLSQKAEPTDAERARLRELKDISNKNTAALATLNDDYGQQVDKRRSELQEKVNADLLAAVAKVATQKGLATVIDKIAVLYGGLDITDDVVKALNEG